MECRLCSWADFPARLPSPSAEDVAFWLSESRTPNMIEELVRRFPIEAARSRRGAVLAARKGAGGEAIADALRKEEAAERAVDASHWQPLKQQLEQFRMNRRGGA